MYNNNKAKLGGVVYLECKKNNHVLTLEFQITSGQQFANKLPFMCGTDYEVFDIIKFPADEIHEASFSATKTPHT